MYFFDCETVRLLTFILGSGTFRGGRRGREEEEGERGEGEEKEREGEQG